MREIASIFIGIIMLAITFTFSYSSSVSNISLIEKEETESYLRFRQAINNQYHHRIEISEVLALSLAHNVEVQRAFYERDREQLLYTLGDAYRQLSPSISQIQFHLPDSTSFLRLHMPDRYGDDLSSFRNTVNKANRLKQIVRGLEEGRGGYGFRVVVPMWYQGTYLGTVESGVELGSIFITDLKRDFKGDYFIYPIHESQISWVEQGEFLFGTQSYDPWKLDEESKELLIKGLPSRNITADENYNIFMVPFVDFNGDVKGYFKFVQDRREAKDAIKKIKNSLYSIGFLCLMLAFILLISLVDKAKDLNEKRKKEHQLEAYSQEINRKNQELSQAYKKIREDIRKAHLIHSQFISDDMPQLESFEIKAYYRPAKDLGGDFYSFKRLDEDRLLFYISDVSGHGLDGAMFNIFIKNCIDNYIDEHSPDIQGPKEILDHVYAKYCREKFPDDYFICISMGILDLQTKELICSNSGVQIEPWLVEKDGEIKKLDCTGLPISSTYAKGVVEFRESRTKVAPGTVLFYTTDGLIEKTDQDGNIYGYENIERVLVENRDKSAAVILKDLIIHMEETTGSCCGEDDVTVLVIKVL